MARFAVGVEYDGSGFAGWQRQRHAVRTVQAIVEQALSQVAAEPLQLQCAGRTDTGVHATAQIAHFDSAAIRPLHAWLLGGNANLPDDVALRWVVPVSDHFHARFSALRRRYRYLILNQPTRSALQRQRVCWERQPLDLSAMQQAATHLLGEHDFSAYRAAGCQAKQPVRTIYHLQLWREGDMLLLEVEANAFLHHMVRNIAGVLLTIGRGEQPPAWAGTVLASRDRRAAGATAPPGGLYLTAVHYPAEFKLPQTPTLPQQLPLFSPPPL